MSAPTVVGVLDKLEAKGLVVRYRSTRDRRVVHVRTTEAGQAALEESPDLLGDGFIAAFVAGTAHAAGHTPANASTAPTPMAPSA